MSFSVTVTSISRAKSDFLAVGVGQLDGRLPETLRRLDRMAGGAIRRVVSSGDFRGEAKEAILVYPPKRFQRLLLLGLGEGEPSRDALRVAASTAGRKAISCDATTVTFLLPEEVAGTTAPEDQGQVLVEGLAQGVWSFEEYKSRGKKKGLPELELVSISGERSELEAGVELGLAVAEGQKMARELQAEPGNVCNPEFLAERARNMAERHKFKVTILTRAELERAGMGGILGVCQGSTQEPRLIVLEYRGKRRGTPICLVGKGVTFDTGGISIKPAGQMEEMKYDMSGAAAVLGAFEFLGRHQPAVNVVGLVPAVENMPSGSAIRPGDILTSHQGKTIEVINTDAEGRLILADALSYAKKFRPQCCIDAATLTGAIIIGLGHEATGLMGNDDDLIEEVRAAGERAGERCWPLPLWDEYREQLKSDVADIKNVGGRPAGSITAGWFLREFVDGFPWCHLDIAGTAYTDSEKPHLAKGPTGTAVRSFAEFILSRSEV